MDSDHSLRHGKFTQIEIKSGQIQKLQLLEKTDFSENIDVNSLHLKKRLLTQLSYLNLAQCSQSIKLGKFVGILKLILNLLMLSHLTHQWEQAVIMPQFK